MNNNLVLIKTDRVFLSDIASSLLFLGHVFALWYFVSITSICSALITILSVWMLPTVCFTTSYSPNDEYPSMKIATEDILSGLLPKFPSALLLRGYKRCKILSQGELDLK